MELSAVFNWLLMVIKWGFMIAAFLLATILAGITLLFGVSAYNEKKTYAKDGDWKSFLIITIVIGVLSCVFGFIGYLLI